MKQLIRTTGMLMLAAAVLFSCAGNAEQQGETKEKKSAKKEKNLTLDEKAGNTFKNTTLVFTGSMLLAFNEMFKTAAEDLSGTFEKELTDEDIATLDEKIAAINEETMKPLEEMIVQMDEAFDDLSEENLTIYEKMFLHDVMKEGVAITEKYDLPAGFRPLSQNLSDEEIKRYVIKVTVDGSDMEDPVIKTYMELFEWFQKVGTAFNEDPEIQSFLEGLRK